MADPRLEAIAATSEDPIARLTARVRALEQRLARAEGGGARRAAGGVGAPTQPVPDGVTYADGTPGAPRLWMRVGGVWRFTALT